jgi:hypothetical protein
MPRDYDTALRPHLQKRLEEIQREFQEELRGMGKRGPG